MKPVKGAVARTARLRATAYHEAGHVVVALWGGDRPKRVTIIPEGDTLGHVVRHSWGSRFRPDIETTPRRAQQLQAAIDTLLAGVSAECRATGRRHNWTGAESDMHEACRLASYLNGSARQIELYLAWRRECVRAEVEIRWADIERLAEVLLVRQTLEGDQLRRIVFDLNAPGTKP